MNDLDDELAGALERLADQAPHHPDLAGTARRRARRRRRRVGTAIAAGSLAAALTGLLAFPDGPFGGSKDSSNVAVAGTTPCRSTIVHAVLPPWARAGFSEPEPVMPFVRSADGNLVAILFVDELASPPRPTVGNKVLWVWQQLPADVATLHATARLNGTGPAVTTGLPTPAGPSYVNLPSPGCWRLTLSWPGGHDTIDLRAFPPSRPKASP
jgi:hypothetical protein